MFIKDFAKLVFSGKKKLLLVRNTTFVQVIKYDELSVKNLYDDFLSLKGMADYFPDTYAKGRQCDREYMFNVANTLHYNVVQEIIQRANEQRYNINMPNQREEAILMSEHWKQELKSLPMRSTVSVFFID